MARAMAVLVGLQAVPVGITPQCAKEEIIEAPNFRVGINTLFPTWSFPIRQVPYHREKHYSTKVQALGS